MTPNLAIHLALTPPAIYWTWWITKQATLLPDLKDTLKKEITWKNFFAEAWECTKCHAHYPTLALTTLTTTLLWQGPTTLITATLTYTTTNTIHILTDNHINKTGWPNNPPTIQIKEHN